MPHPILVAIPFASAVVYALAALFIKRALQTGANPYRVTLSLNLAMGAGSLIFLLFESEPMPGAMWYMPVLAACAYTIGTILNTFALQHGDVSVATPLLGTKVLFVAFFAVVINGITMPPTLWAAGVLVVVALFLMRPSPKTEVSESRFGLTVVLSIFSASCFALCDAFFQQFAQLWGFSRFIPAVFVLVAIFSCGMLVLIPRGETINPIARRARLIGSTLNGIQALGVAICLSLWAGGATTVNILYSSRGLWSVGLVWVIGHWWANSEQGLGGAILGRRLVGAAILTAAIVLALLETTG